MLAHKAGTLRSARLPRRMAAGAEGVVLAQQLAALAVQVVASGQKVHLQAAQQRTARAEGVVALQRQA